MSLRKNSTDLISLINHCEDKIAECHNDLIIIRNLDPGNIGILNDMRLEISNKIDLYCIILEQLRLYNR